MGRAAPRLGEGPETGTCFQALTPSRRPAVGALVHRHTLTPDRALDLLRAHALSTDTDLTTLAYAIVYEHLTLPDVHDPHP
ncbi:hypothetical protein GCM10010358_83080 [Streptomyces minutiscleroticus]|uniref:ANTAR domain-containing protein n=1 Tax=Streptomyces minutiscleroticus TaxID=68238 RepID=A0A918P432_9ACTN|nr:ANTAR domain-containing protein [Streptomyces minutiscleroticus]GGY20003.1 hypothetical protein GCM10010358_83080 [Streptomyces minutiscleroticus]